MPLDYITGYGEFYGFKVKVNENVLIPRLDTEILADEVIKYLNRTEKDCEVLDLMTGSGCIALAIAKKLPRALLHRTFRLRRLKSPSRILRGRVRKSSCPTASSLYLTRLST